MKKLIYTLCIAVAVAGCSSKGAKQNNNMERMEVSAQMPVVEDVKLANQYPAALSADKSIQLVARVNGYLQKVAYSPGEGVKKGRLLFVIEPNLYQDKVKNAQAQVEAAKAQLDYATTTYNKSVEAARSSAISEIDLLQAKTSMESAAAKLKEAQAALSTANTNLSYCYVRAPQDGKMSVNYYGSGAYINGEASPVVLATLYDDRKLYVNFTIPEAKIPILQNLDTLEVAYAGVTERFPGKIDYISPNVDLATGTLKVRGYLYNRDNLLRDGLYVTVNLPYSVQRNAVLVLDNAIGVNQSGKYIYTLQPLGNDEYKVQFRHVEVGKLVNDSLRIVESGIAPDELYVSKAILKVNNGDIVTLKR